MLKLGELLVSEGLVSPEELQEALDFQEKRGGLLGTALVRLGFVTEDGIRSALADKYGIPLVDLGERESDPQALKRLPREKAVGYGAFPVALEGNRLIVAISDPTNVLVLDELRFASGCEITPVLAREKDILTAIETKYPAPKDRDVEREEPSAGFPEFGEDEPGRLLADLVASAIRKGASEIHLETLGEQRQARLRVGESLQNLPLPPGEIQDALVTRLRTLCHLRESERRRSQTADLSLQLQLDGSNQAVLLLVSTLSTVRGERFLLELVRPGDRVRDLSSLGLELSALSRLRSALEGTHGLILVTGPSRSGKSTTFYSLLAWLNRDDRFILSAEDRIECPIVGVHQISLSGHYFQYEMIAGMKPDVLCVKGLASPEAMAIVLEVARGRIVLAELEAFDCASAFYRFPRESLYWLSRSARFITNQRLLPRLCQECREPTEPGPEAQQALRLAPQDLEGLRFFRPRGCPSCGTSGYRGLTGIFEWTDIDATKRRSLLEAPAIPSPRDLKASGISSSMREAALKQASEGTVALQDVLSL